MKCQVCRDKEHNEPATHRNCHTAFPEPIDSANTTLECPSGWEGACSITTLFLRGDLYGTLKGCAHTSLECVFKKLTKEGESCFKTTIFEHLNVAKDCEKDKPNHGNGSQNLDAEIRSFVSSSTGRQAEADITELIIETCLCYEGDLCNAIDTGNGGTSTLIKAVGGGIGTGFILTSAIILTTFFQIT